MVGQEAGQPGLYYVSAKAVWPRINKQGEKEVLILKTSGENWYWDIPGGRINAGETDILLALKRELSEEMGWGREILDQMTIKKCWGIDLVDWYQLPGSVGLICSYYQIDFALAPEKVTDQIQLNDEHQSWKWVRWTELAQLKNADGRELDWGRSASLIVNDDSVI